MLLAETSTGVRHADRPVAFQFYVKVHPIIGGFESAAVGPMDFVVS
jgi:Zn-dependent alcohol dehydrogenase